MSAPLSLGQSIDQPHPEDLQTFMDIMIKCLQNTQRSIQQLEKQQNVIYRQTLKALKIKQTDEPAATILFDYLYNKTWSATETLKRLRP